MPELQWDELDFLECLEVVPQVEEYGISYSYEVHRDSLRLLVTVWPMESAVQWTLWQASIETPLLDFALFVRGAVRHINDKRGEYLEFQDCVVAPNRFWQIEAGDVFDSGNFAGLTAEIGVKPHIRFHFA